MKTQMFALRLALALGLVLGLVSGCHKDKEAAGPMERAGKGVDTAADKTVDGVKKGAEKTKEGVGKAADATGKAFDNVGKKLKGDGTTGNKSPPPAK